MDAEELVNEGRTENYQPPDVFKIITNWIMSIGILYFGFRFSMTTNTFGFLFFTLLIFGASLILICLKQSVVATWRFMKHDTKAAGLLAGGFLVSIFVGLVLSDTFLRAYRDSNEMQLKSSIEKIAEINFKLDSMMEEAEKTKIQSNHENIHKKLNGLESQLAEISRELDKVKWNVTMPRQRPN